jgi:hypothetical protein
MEDGMFKGLGLAIGLITAGMIGAPAAMVALF